MEPRTLYVGWSGFAVKALSYSQASDISDCGKKFELKRVSGWDEAHARGLPQVRHRL